MEKATCPIWKIRWCSEFAYMRKYFPNFKFFVEIQLDCKAEDLSRLWDWDECIAQAGISEASPFQGHIGKGGKKPKVTWAGEWISATRETREATKVVIWKRTCSFSIPRPYRGRGKKPKVIRAGMNKCVDLCRHLSNQEYISATDRISQVDTLSWKLP